MNIKVKRILIILSAGAVLISAFHFSKWGFTSSCNYDNTKKDEKLEAALKVHVVKLSDEIPLKSKSSYNRIKISAEYIKAEFKKAGYTPETQKYDISSMHFENIFVTKKGLTDRLLIIGAHYDTYFNPKRLKRKKQNFPELLFWNPSGITLINLLHKLILHCLAFSTRIKETSQR